MYGKENSVQSFGMIKKGFIGIIKYHLYTNPNTFLENK